MSKARLITQNRAELEDDVAQLEHRSTAHNLIVLANRLADLEIILEIWQVNGRLNEISFGIPKVIHWSDGIKEWVFYAKLECNIDSYKRKDSLGFFKLPAKAARKMERIVRLWAKERKHPRKFGAMLDRVARANRI